MAREANLPSCHLTHPKALERFAALVADSERERITKAAFAAAEKAIDSSIAGAEKRIKAAFNAEREACAKIVENYCGAWDDQGYALANAIRARGEK
jgi:CHASE3 domain sensor protein